MIKLRLCEYNKDGKFERFLKLGKDFGYCGEFILVTTGALDLFFKYSLPKQPNQKAACQEYVGVFKRDEKDPLNRFDGLFDNRTYGEGRFILIVDEQDNVENADIDGRQGIYTTGFLKNTTNSYVFIGETLGNLHKNPELWKKLK
jgi:hypothetical protein